MCPRSLTDPETPAASTTSAALASSASSSRTRGITSVPYSSMLRIIASWGSSPALYFRSNAADAERRRRSRRSCGRPSPASRRRASRSDPPVVELGAGRRAPAALGPIRSRIFCQCGHSCSRASSSVAAMWPGECTPTGRAGRSELGQRPVVEVDERREAGALAADDGEHQRQSVLRGADHRLGLPPTPTQVVSEPDSVRGYTCWSVERPRGSCRSSHRLLA